MKSSLTVFLGGKIRVHQPVRGYRFNVDSVCLSSFAWVREGETVLDLGTGSGILLLILANFHHPGSLVGVEIQPGVAEMAARNLEENGLSETGRILAADFRVPAAFPEGRFDLVVCNPPYYEVGREKASPDPARAMARHSFTAGFDEVLAAGARALGPGGRFCLLCPGARLAEVLAAARAAGLRGRLMRPVRSAPGAEPHLVLLQLRREEGRGCVSLPPLLIRGGEGTYTPELAYWLGQREPATPRFFCDAMLGRLARYLRLSGADAAYARGADDDWLLAEAERSGRILLTRDRPLLARCGKAGVRGFDPGSDAVGEQLGRVAESFLESPERGPLRCVDCNAPVLPVDRCQALGKVPPYTYLTHEQFSACPCCGKLTWEGSHLGRFRKEVIEKHAIEQPSNGS